MMDETRVLDYGEVLLRRSDVDLLRGPHWLNDQIIAFWFEYLAREPLSGHDDILLVPGSITYLLANSGPAEAKLVSEPLQLDTRRLVLLAVNDNPFVEVAGGGSHWTLLVYSSAAGCFWHFDSAGGSAGSGSAAAAGAVAQALSPHLRGIDDQTEVCIMEVSTPRQHNGYDCGMHVLGLAQIISAAHVTAKARGAEGLDHAPGAEVAAMTAMAVQQLRMTALKLIEDKASLQ